MVPVANAGTVGLRPLTSETEICAIFDILLSALRERLRERGSVDNKTWNRGCRCIMDKVNAGSVFEELARSSGTSLA